MEVADGAPGVVVRAQAPSHRAKRPALDANAVLQPAPDAPAPAPAAQPRSTMQMQTQGTGTTTGIGTKHASKSSSSNPKLDTDKNLLRAVNSTKRGKKLEDDFDCKFNLPRIAKPSKKVDGIGTATAAVGATSGSEGTLGSRWTSQNCG